MPGRWEVFKSPVAHSFPNPSKSDSKLFDQLHNNYLWILTSLLPSSSSNRMSEEINSIVIFHPTPGKEARVRSSLSYLLLMQTTIANDLRPTYIPCILTTTQLKEVILELGNTMKENEEGCVGSYSSFPVLSWPPFTPFVYILSSSKFKTFIFMGSLSLACRTHKHKWAYL